MARIDYDRYPSEPAMVTELLDRVRISERELVLEPTAGSGQLAGSLKQAGLNVVTNDIAYGSVRWRCTVCDTKQWSSVLTSNVEDDWSFLECGQDYCKSDDPLRRVWLDQERYHTDNHFDAATDALWHNVGKFDWVIGNPPFSQLEPILERSLAHSARGVAFILRLTALEPACKRSERGELLDYFADNMRFIMPFSGPRPSFTEDGKTDSVTTAWFVWMHGWSWSNYVGVRSPFQFIMNWKA